MAEVTMPRLSDTMEEGTISAWLKQPGEQVSKGDVIAQIETDKATMDLTAFEAGTLQEILAPEGTTVAIGKPVARIGSGKAAPPATPEVTPPAAEETGSETPQTPEARENVGEAPEPTASASQQPEITAEQPSPSESSNGKVRASPMARHIAAEHGLDLSGIAGSGPQGRVIRADVEAALGGQCEAPETAPQHQPPPPQPAQAGEGDERVSLSQMRRTIARRMAESTRTVPHFYLTTVVDATELGALRKQINELATTADAGIKISFNDLIVKGAALAIRKVPEVNVSFAEDSLIRHSRVHVGIAVATERGLIVPVVRDADQKSVGQIARESRDLAERANAGKLQPPEYSGGTFSVSNLGMFGVEQFQAVINPPESAILAVGAITREPAEYQGEIALRDRLRLTLSVDHRALDGAMGARYLQALKVLLEKPMLLLV
jgi:pyruvate dehydrogenase E2 component (dihydrolipoamide acetyltransferase)